MVVEIVPKAVAEKALQACRRGDLASSKMNYLIIKSPQKNPRPFPRPFPHPCPRPFPRPSGAASGTISTTILTTISTPIFTPLSPPFLPPCNVPSDVLGWLGAAWGLTALAQFDPSQSKAIQKVQGRSTPIRLVRANQKQPTSCETAAGRNENTQKLLISGIPSIPSDHTCEAHQSYSSRGRFFVGPESQGRKEHVRERPSISTHFSFCSAPTLTEIHQILSLGLPNSFPQAVWGFMARLAAGRKRRGTRRRGTRTWWGRDAPTTAFAPAEIFPVYRQVIPSHSKSS